MHSKAPIDYIERTRDYYLALGYGNPYEWASFGPPPFAPLAKPLGQATVGIVVTAAPYKPGAGPQGPGAPHNGAARFFEVWGLPAEGEPPDLRISHVTIDRDHTTAEDPGTYFPLKALRRCRDEGRIGALAPLVFGFPTNRSQRTNIETDAPRLLAMMREAGCDAAVLVPNCPVCHQSVAIAARHLEADGMPTVIMGCAKDIVERAGVPRFLFSDFPLGNGAGRPNDPEGQFKAAGMALDLLESAEEGGATRANPQEWSEDHSWKEDFLNAGKLTAEEIAARRAAFDGAKTAAKEARTAEEMAKSA